MSDYTDWVAGTLRGLGAPLDATNQDTLWAWSGTESGPVRMRWNNPLNTTWNLPGSVNMNGVGVKRYASVADGITATVRTLLQPRYYGIIVNHLRASVPRAQWGDACGELGLWGTGCGWLSRNFGAAEGALEDQTMDQATFNALVAGSPLANLAGGIVTTYQAVVASQKAILAALAALPTGGGLTPAQAQELQEAHDAAEQTLTDLKDIFKAA
jgi:hypothetical protein